jgi:hypothetical protein
MRGEGDLTFPEALLDSSLPCQLFQLYRRNKMSPQRGAQREEMEESKGRENL